MTCFIGHPGLSKKYIEHFYSWLPEIKKDPRCKECIRNNEKEVLPVDCPLCIEKNEEEKSEKTKINPLYNTEPFFIKELDNDEIDWE